MATVRLSWWNRVQADSIKVYRSTSPFAKDSLPTALDTISASATEYDDTTASAGTIYYYRLGVVEGASVAASDLVTVTTAGAGADVRITEAGDTRITEAGDTRILE